MLHTDSIEANVESAEVHVERGTDQLQRAAYYQVQEPCFISKSQEPCIIISHGLFLLLC